jgi:hypothetical protein
MTMMAFEPIISARELPQTHALSRSATGIGRQTKLQIINKSTGNVKNKDPSEIKARISKEAYFNVRVY